MTKIKRTAEQEAVVKAAIAGKSFYVRALAGSAKTTTLMECVREIKDATPTRDIRVIAFNKKIADEMQDKMNVKDENGVVTRTLGAAQTLNSLGHRAWQSVCGKKLRLNGNKTGDLIKAFIETQQDQSLVDLLWDSFGEIKSTIGLAKQVGWIPGKMDEQFWDQCRFNFDRELRAITTAIMKNSIQEAKQGHIDFDDQIYMSVCFSAPFPKADVLMVDEAQDLSPLNHTMLARMKPNQLIVVGDPNQAIYGFRGAAENSMEKLATRFDLTPYQLTTCFRCPINVVKEAHWKTPEMKWASHAIEGEVHVLTKWNETVFKSGDTVICRNNAPLFTLAVRLITRGIFPEIEGRDVGKRIINIFQKFSKKDIPQEKVFSKIRQWREREIEKQKDTDAVEDVAACLELFAENGESLHAIIAYIENMIARSGSILLMTGHKSKGRQFPHVYVLDRERCNLDYDQDANLLYVMQTRATETMTYLSLDNMTDELEEKEETKAE